MTSVGAVAEGIFLARPEGAEAVPPGMRLAVKDLFDTEGLVTTYGSILFAEHVPAETAEAVRRLEAAGYVDVGKTNLHEFAYGTTSENPHFGTVPNPLAPGRIAGGSSGGSAAALAAGLAELGLGTDTGGSIRIPAACCGVTGFKPTYGLVPLDGCFPLASSFDHAGPMARDVDGCSRALEVLAPGFAPTEVELDDIRVGVLWLELADPLVRARVDAAAARFPHRQRLDVPLPQGIWPVFMREVADVHRELYEEHRDSYSENVGAKIDRCLAVTDADYGRAVETRELYRERLLEAAADVDLLLTPNAHVRRSPNRPGRARPPRDAHEAHVPVQRGRLACAGTPVRTRRGRAARLGAARRPARLGCARARRRGRARNRLCPSTESLERVTPRRSGVPKSLERWLASVVVSCCWSRSSSADLRRRARAQPRKGCTASRCAPTSPSSTRSRGHPRSAGARSGARARTSSSSRPAGASTTTRSSGLRTA